jgi:hypothetical protein
MTPTSDQLPATIDPAALTTPAPAVDTYIVPPLIGNAGDQAGWRYVEFFRNPHTGRAYAWASAECENRGLTLATIRPIDVAT